MNLYQGKKNVALETNCNVTYSASKKLSLLIPGTELEEEIITIGYEGFLQHVSWEAVEPELLPVVHHSTQCKYMIIYFLLTLI